MPAAKKTKPRPAQPSTPPEALPRIEYMRLEDLKPWPGNPKKHATAAAKASILRFGFNAPVLLDEASGCIVAGHGRTEAVAALKADGKPPPARVQRNRLGEWLVPVMRGLTFRSREEAQAYLLADNRIGELGGWDDEALQEMLRELASIDGGMEGVGWTEREISNMLAAADDSGLDGPTPLERSINFLNASIKQIVLFFPAEQYDHAIARMDAAMEKADKESHTDTLLALLDAYELLHKYSVPAPPVVATEAEMPTFVEGPAHAPGHE